MFLSVIKENALLIEMLEVTFIIAYNVLMYKKVLALKMFGMNGALIGKNI